MNYWRRLHTRTTLTLKYYLLAIMHRFRTKNANTQVLLFSVLTPDYVTYFDKLHRSICERGNIQGVRWRVICVGFSYLEYQTLVNSFSRLSINVEFVSVDSDYDHWSPFVRRDLRAALNKFLSFEWTETHLLWLDLDVVCLGDLSGLLDQPSFGLTVCGTDYIENTRRLFFSFNTGVALFSVELVELLGSANMGSLPFAAETADQAVLNWYLRFVPKNSLARKYNFHATKYYDLISSSDVRLLHFAGPKPHETKRLQKWWNL